MCRARSDSMAKKRSWFSLVKRLFSLDSWYKHEKTRKKWSYRVKVRSRLPAVEAQLPQPERREREESEEEKRNHALDVAIASAAAAQAAIEAAQVAAEVVLLTGAPKSDHQWGKEEDKPVVNVQYNLPDFTSHCGKDIREVAAIRIQSTFRGYLARKALRALKGIVKLQAIIRGTNVRRQAMTTLKCLQSLVSIQSKVQAKRVQMVEEPCNCNDNKQLQSSSDDKNIKMETNRQRRWDGSILTKEEANASFMSEKEAALRRERIREYAHNHRNSIETERNKVNGRWRYWMEKWIDTQLNKSKELEDLDWIMTSNPKPRVHYRGKQLKQRGTQIAYQSDGFDSPITHPRRPFHRKQYSLGEDNSFSCSLVVPTYMVATESAKAKRSLSSLKLRPGSFDAYSDSYSPRKNKLSLVTSTASEVPSRVRFGNCNAHQQRSPSLKGLTGPVKSSRTLLNDLSFDSDYSFRTCQLQK